MKYLYTLLASLFLFCTTALAADFDVNGAWFDAENPGWGIVIDDEPSTGAFLAMFTYAFYTATPGQAWYVGYTPAEEVDVDEPYAKVFRVNRPQGATFPANGWVQAAPAGTITIDEIDENNILVTWRFGNEWPCVTPRVSPSPGFCIGDVVFTRFLPTPEVE